MANTFKNAATGSNTDITTKVYFEYILKDERSNPLKGATGRISDFSNVPYDNVIYKNKVSQNQINYPYLPKKKCAVLFVR